MVAAILWFVRGKRFTAVKTAAFRVRKEPRQQSSVCSETCLRIFRRVFDKFVIPFFERATNTLTHKRVFPSPRNTSGDNTPKRSPYYANRYDGGGGEHGRVRRPAAPDIRRCNCNRTAGVGRGKKNETLQPALPSTPGALRVPSGESPPPSLSAALSSAVSSGGPRGHCAGGVLLRSEARSLTLPPHSFRMVVPLPARPMFSSRAEG